MPGTPTPNLGLTVPTVGGDSDAWGTELNGDLAIIDNLGAATVISQSASFNAVASVFPEVIYRVTTGAATITCTLPSPSACTGRIFTIKKIDAGVGQVSIVGSIDGQSSWVRATQWSYVRLASNGASFDVIGNN